jgi:dimethylargininase
MTTARFTHALVREVSRSLADCELTHLPRQRIDVVLARRQHAAYVAALESVGVNVRVLPEVPDLPDSSFVEDPVVMLDEVAIACRPGAASRRPEVELMMREVAALRPIHAIAAPGTLEGGDVLVVGRRIFVGVSSRTNRDGIGQFARIVAPFGYDVKAVTVKKCLHLKSAVTSPANGLLLANPDWIEATEFAGLEIIATPAEEPGAANVLAVNGRVFVVKSSPRTAELLAARGLDVRTLDISELQKAEAALTCESVLYRDV